MIAVLIAVVVLAAFVAAMTFAAMFNARTMTADDWAAAYELQARIGDANDNR